jgi:glycosyltransferase involved in cell wall biosynthesis
MTYSATTMKKNIDMIGPVPADWGGIKRHGGVVIHVQGLVLSLPVDEINLRLLADNTDMSVISNPHNFPKEFEFHALARKPKNLSKLGVNRIARLFWRIISNSDLRYSAPASQLLRYLGFAVNYDHFLVHSHADLLHVHHAEFRQFICQRIIRTKLPLLATVHSATVLIHLAPDWLRDIVIRNYSNADWLIAVSNYVKETIVRNGANPDRITVIPNGVDIIKFRPDNTHNARHQLKLNRHGNIVLFTGNLKTIKGVDVLIRAISRSKNSLSNHQLYILGKGPEKTNLINLANDLGVANKVTFVGFIPREQIPLWYQACDVFVMPSSSEGLSLSVLEAMSTGRPVITTTPDFGEHDAIISEETGLLVDYGEIDQLSQALDNIATYPEFASNLGNNARTLAERKFSWDIVGKKTIDVYNKLLTRKAT